MLLSAPRRDQLPSLAALLLLLGTACSSEEVGAPTGSTCPENSRLTYENFGQEFMSSYCIDCHDSSLVGAERHGAPSDHNFDSLSLIHETALEHIDENAAAGPLGINRVMPERGSAPSDDERRELGEWLACGAP